MACDMSQEDKDREAKWRAENDLRTLVEAEEIRQDPKRLKAAKKIGREQSKNLRSAMSKSDG